MFTFFYNLFVYASLALARVVALFHAKTKRWVAGQQQFKILQRAGVLQHNGPTVWFHAASLGEFEQGRPVIEAFRAAYPDYRIVLTFFSPSGYELQHQYQTADVVLYLPADTPANVQQFLDAVRPTMALFIKYEFWHNYLTALHKRHIPTLLFSAIFRPNQLFFKPYGGFYRNMLFCFDQILVQNEASRQLLASINYPNAIWTGDTRLDRVAQIAHQAREVPLVAEFKNQTPLLIVGSAWPDDMAVLIPFLNQWAAPLKIIVAPHEINGAQIESWQKQLKRSSIKWSEANKHNVTDYEMVFVDSIGLLSRLYRYADFAFVGGAYGDGLHNILEPAAFGMPLFFGNLYYDKFQEAVDLCQQKAAHAVANAPELQMEFAKVYQNKNLQRAQAQTTRAYVQTHAGATLHVLQVIQQILR